MSKHRVAVLKVVTNQSSVTAAAAEFGLSRGHLHRLLRRYREGGLEAVEPRSRRPRGSPQRTPEAVRERIVALRTELTAQGLDAGPLTIAWHLEREGLRAPSTSTIRRVLHAAGLVTPEPHKRPRSSWRRFEAAMPNEVWQSDMTHWWLADGTEVEIRSWLDDHSRYLLGCTAFGRVDGHDVVATLLRRGRGPRVPCGHAHRQWRDLHLALHRRPRRLRAPARLPRHPAAERSPNHPQTQGKVERFHRTLKRWLRQQPAARTLAELQARLDTFRLAYDEARPHRAIGRRTPAEAYRATPKALPAGPRAQGHLRLRYDTVDKAGAMTLRRPAASTTWGSGPPIAVAACSRSSTRREVTVVDARDRRGALDPSASNPSGTTGATNDETPADGRGPKRLHDR